MYIYKFLFPAIFVRIPKRKGPVITGWLRLVGSLKLQVTFAEYSLLNRALLQKRRIFLGSLLVSSNNYVSSPYVEEETGRLLKNIDLFCKRAL